MSRKVVFQVAAPAVLIGLALVATCLVGIWSIQRLQNNLGHILSRSVASLQAALELENAIRQVRHHSLLYLTGWENASLPEIEQAELHFEAALDKARSAAQTDEARGLLSGIDGGYHKYKKEMAELRAAVSREGPRQDLQQLVATHPIRPVVDACEELRRADKKHLDKTAAESEQVSRWASWALLLAAIAGPLGGVLCGYGMVRGLSRSIGRLQVRVHDVAHRLGASESAAAPREELIDVGSLMVASDGDLAELDRQLEHVLRRVEEVMERLRRQHWDMLRAEQLAAVGQLAAGVAHEVRNPLMAIKMLVEAGMRPGRRNDLSEEDLRVIRGEIVRIEETVEHFLSFARLPAPNRQVCDLRDALGPSLDLMRARARRQQVELFVSMPAGPVPVDLDASQFHQVLLNLLMNALDAMPQGGRVLLSVAIAGKFARLSVLDTGTGISPEMQARLFTPFASGKPTGTGLGLSLARRIIEEHGGTIRGENHPDGGACFTIVLPLAAVSPAPPEGSNVYALGHR
jgi:signal transduction histidine kinase